MPRAFSQLVCVVLAVLLAASVADAQREKGSSRGESAKNSDRPQPADGARSLTPAREAAALTFAKLHHPELHALLDQLKQHNRPQYEKAVRQLFLDSERLARLRERSPQERYELELEAWQLDSRIRLLAAKLTMSDDEKLKEDLKTAYLRRVEIRLQLLEAERERAAARLEKLDETIEKLRQDLQSNVSEVVLKDVERMRKNLREQRAPNKDAENTPSKSGRPEKSSTGNRRSNPASQVVKPRER